VEVSGRVRMVAAFLDQKPGQGGAIGQHLALSRLHARGAHECRVRAHGLKLREPEPARSADARGIEGISGSPRLSTTRSASPKSRSFIQRLGVATVSRRAALAAAMPLVESSNATHATAGTP